MFKILLFLIIIIVLFLIINNSKYILNYEYFKSGTSKSSGSSKISTILNNTQQKDNLEKKKLEKKVMFSNKDYNENLSIDNKDNQYFYTDMINQSNINETAFNIVYSIDPIDYADVETGLEKCNRECDGVCFENGYDGIATCYPKETTGFDFGTLYKNPTFTYGYNAYGPGNLKK